MEHTDLSNRTVLITGGTGSLGQKLTSTILKYNPKAIRIYSRGEFLQWEMKNKFQDSRLRFFIGDIRDKERLERALIGCDTVIHTAALKQVPSCEYNPIEAIRTNIDGAVNVINASLDNEVKKVLAISSDKAVQPINIYGATKMCMEKLFINANVYSAHRPTIFSCVRYGNVIGSRGSVVPKFNEQRLSGTVTITNSKMTRFWITIEQGVDLVLFALNNMGGGEIFLPKLKSMRITQLAEIVAPDCKHDIIGTRAGEKIHEILMTLEESTRAREVNGYYVIYPEGIGKGKKISMFDEFEYSSDKVLPLTDSEIKEMLCQSMP